MGTLTEFRFKAVLKKDAPDIIIYILNETINNSRYVHDEEALPHEAFFHTRRWTSLLRSNDWYQDIPGGKFYKRSERWTLDLHTGFRNYADQIPHFLRWIKPYIEGRKIKKYLGYIHPEYFAERSYIHLNQVTGEFWDNEDDIATENWPEGFDPERVDGTFHMGFFNIPIEKSFYHKDKWFDIDKLTGKQNIYVASELLAELTLSDPGLISITLPALQNFLQNHIAIWISNLPPIKPSAKWFGMSPYQFHFLRTDRESIGKPMIFGTMGDPVVDYASMFRNIWDSDHGIKETIKWKATTKESFDGNTFGHRYYVDEAGIWEQPILKADVWEGENPSYYGVIVIKPRRVGFTREYLESLFPKHTTTGIPDLDIAMGGDKKGYLPFVMGRPGTGKSSFMISYYLDALNIFKSNKESQQISEGEVPLGYYDALRQIANDPNIKPIPYYSSETGWVIPGEEPIKLIAPKLAPIKAIKVKPKPWESNKVNKGGKKKNRRY